MTVIIILSGNQPSINNSTNSDNGIIVDSNINNDIATVISHTDTVHADVVKIERILTTILKDTTRVIVREDSIKVIEMRVSELENIRGMSVDISKRLLPIRYGLNHISITVKPEQRYYGFAFVPIVGAGYSANLDNIGVKFTPYVGAKIFYVGRFGLHAGVMTNGVGGGLCMNIKRWVPLVKNTNILGTYGTGWYGENRMFVGVGVEL